MKTLCHSLKGGFLFLLFAAVLTGSAFAQTTGSNVIPVVTINATQPIASGPASPGVFTVFRQGNTNEALDIYYNIGGSASNGVDYARISNFVEIPVGTVSNTIIISPLASPSAGAAAKTVVLQLGPSPLMIPVNYEIGVPSNAVVYITGSNATNLPPVVNIVNPLNGSVYYTPTNILLAAKASDPDGSISNVEFFAGTNDLGPGGMAVLEPPGINGVTGPIYIFNWQNVPVGQYPLTAVATDNGGASTVSSVVNISVFQGPPPTNPPPGVRIISPANGSIFFAPVDIPLFAYVNHPFASVGSVQFFDGTNSLGFGQPVPISPVASPVYVNNLYSLVWSNAPVGSNVLTAQATIIFTNHPLVLLAVSDPVNVTVLPSPPPPTNRPPIVNIVATDPIAIEGTNCWLWMGESNSPPTWAAWSTAVCRCFTNYGPKTATFTVHRFGETTNDVTVTYNIGGTASNGVDYVTLPGFVTVPAGECSALITIVPIDDGPPDVNKTVILSLAPSTNVPPDYLVGFPRRAAAIIVDRPGPCPGTTALPDKCFHLRMPGPDATWFAIECSTNLAGWTPICTNQVINGSIDFIDPDAPANLNRFYQAVPITNTPGN